MTTNEADWNNGGWHSIHRAAFYWDVLALKLMLDGGINPELRTRNSADERPLHVWARGRTSLMKSNPQPAQCLKLLLDAKTDINAVDGSGHSAIQVAVLYHKPTTTALLLEHKSHVNDGLLNLAICRPFFSGSESTAVVEMLLEKGADFTPKLIANAGFFEDNTISTELLLCLKERKFRECKFEFEST